MELAGIPGQGDLNPASLQPRNQDLDLIPEHFRLTKLDQHGRQTGESRLQQIDSGEPGVRALQICILPGIQHFLAEDVASSAFDHAAPFGGRIDPGRKQDTGGRESLTSIAQRDQCGDTERSTGGISRHRHPGGPAGLFDHLAGRRQTVVMSGGKRRFRSQTVFYAKHSSIRSESETGDGVATAFGRARHIASPVQIHNPSLWSLHPLGEALQSGHSPGVDS